MELSSKQQEDTFDLYYQCRSPWQWVFKEAFQELIDARTNDNSHNEISFLSGRVKRCEEVSNARLLPSKNFITKQSKTRRFGCTLRIELASSINSDIFSCYYGTSQAMEGLADKDEFVRTLSNFNCEYLSPPSLLIDWDASESYCLAIKFPTTRHDNNVAVLKTPLGSRGEGVFFISCVEEIVHYVQQNYIRAMEERGNFLKDVYQSKGRFPSWILQAEIYPPMLIERHKFHLRTYVVIFERPDTTKNINVAEALDVYIYTKHEVRIASVPFAHQAREESTTSSCSTCIRNRQAHITNGASSDNTKRCLLHNVKELAHLSEPLEFFIAKAFGCDLLPNMRVQINQDNCDNAAAKFAFSGVDVMIDEQGKFYILEVNVNPAAPPKEVIDAMFHRHLVDLCKDFIRLVVTNDDINTATNLRTTPTRNDGCSTSDATLYNFARASDILKNNLQKYKN